MDTERFNSSKLDCWNCSIEADCVCYCDGQNYKEIEEQPEIKDKLKKKVKELRRI